MGMASAHDVAGRAMTFEVMNRGGSRFSDVII
jgi:hypothetical protein